MLTLETKNAVTHLDILKMTSGGTKSGKVKLVIGGHQITNNPEGTIVEVAFRYQDADGNALPSKHGTVYKLHEGVKELSQSINGSLPADDNIVDRFTNEVKAVAVAMFADEFAIEASEIEEVTQS